MKRFALIFLILSNVAVAFTCWQNEEDPTTTRIFVSEKQYEMAKSEWAARRPPVANPIMLAHAYQIYHSEKDFAESLGRDKRAHCYLGCRIAQETNYRTANFVGWLKEQMDLHDCDRNTHFEFMDYEATIDGSRHGETNRDTFETCVQYCESKW